MESVYIKSYREKGNQTLKIFDSIEGIHINSYANAVIFGNPDEANCLFLDENKVIIRHKDKQQYILRLIKERREFILTQ